MIPEYFLFLFPLLERQQVRICEIRPLIWFRGRAFESSRGSHEKRVSKRRLSASVQVPPEWDHRRRPQVLHRRGPRSWRPGEGISSLRPFLGDIAPSIRAHRGVMRVLLTCFEWKDPSYRERMWEVMIFGIFFLWSRVGDDYSIYISRRGDRRSTKRSQDLLEFTLSIRMSTRWPRGKIIISLSRRDMKRISRRGVILSFCKVPHCILSGFLSHRRSRRRLHIDKIWKGRFEKNWRSFWMIK